MAALTGCGEQTKPAPTKKTAETSSGLESLALAVSKEIPLSRVESVFALGSSATDLQRELLAKELLGAVVRWRLRVYDVRSAERGPFTIISEPALADRGSRLELIHFYAFVTPRSEADLKTMSALKSGDSVVVKGMVKEIMLRSAVVLHPAVLE